MLHNRAQKSVAGKTPRMVLALVLAAALGACLDSGDSEGRSPAGVRPSVPDPVPSPAANAAAPACQPDCPLPSGPLAGAGLWHGQLFQGGRVVEDTTCLVTKTGELSCILRDPSFCCYTQPLRTRDYRPGALHGVVQYDDARRASGSGIIYAAPGKVLADGKSVVADFTITGGTLKDQRPQLELTINSLGEVLTLSASFDHYYYMHHSWPCPLCMPRFPSTANQLP